MEAISRLWASLWQQRGRAVVFLALCALAAAIYLPTVAGLVLRWANEQDYLYGFLVIPFAILLAYLRREMIPEEIEGSLWGIALLLLSGIMRFLATYLYLELLDAASLVPCMAGIVLLGLGWRVMAWLWPSLVFLVFMIPLPAFLAEQFSAPLQQIGAVASTYLLQTFGIPAVVHGNVIRLPDGDLGVEEACSGLRMMMLFLAVSTGTAMIVQRDTWERLVIVVSPVVIAVIANIMRITLTGLLHSWAGTEFAGKFQHDLAGYFMMPMAVFLLWIELMVMSTLFRPSWHDAEWS